MRSDLMAKNRENDELGPNSAGQSGDTQQIQTCPTRILKASRS